ncbi:hypothetical protein [Halalkalicoccus subterraneus]|uniref:hypothetical protein n=1 Tax=Halalkalicoccus subterraneus TaxID=2675002 RepID=UPI000EFB5E46|nr:hypothetical protein [Halalkalicoccus subterraneus]
MIEFVPLQLLDDIIQAYNLGQVLIAVFVLAVLGSFALSKKLLSLNVVLFGVVFLLAPSNLSPLPYKMFGLALIVIGPVLYTTARS